MPRTAASAAPARPPSADPTAASASASSGARRAHAEVRPATCSANVFRPHSGFSHRSTRTRSRITTGRPPAARSCSGPGVPVMPLTRQHPASRARHERRRRPRPHDHPPPRPPRGPPPPPPPGAAAAPTAPSRTTDPDCTATMTRRPPVLRRLRHPARYQEPAPRVTPPRRTNHHHPAGNPPEPPRTPKPPLPARDMRQSRCP
jgi:hypothetical protein